MHLVNGTGNSPSPGRPTPGVVKQDKSSGGSVDTLVPTPPLYLCCSRPTHTASPPPHHGKSRPVLKMSKVFCCSPLTDGP